MRHEIVNFMTPNRKGMYFWSKINVFLKNLLLYYVTWFSQTKYIVIMTKKGSTKNLNMMSPGAGVLVLGRCHISHVVKMHSSLLPGIDQTNYVYRNDDQ